MKFKGKKIQKSKLKTVVLVLLLTLSMASIININDNFSNANQEVETLKTSAPITPKYKYIYETDFDYVHHETHLPTIHPSVISEDLSGDDTEWSQDPTDADNLKLGYNGGLNPWEGKFFMNGIIVIESHNTFEKPLDPNLGVYIDWSIDLDIISVGIDLGSIQSYISISIVKPTVIEELVTIDDLNLQEGTFYLANFKEYIWDDGKIRFTLSGYISGTTLWNVPNSLIYASINFKGLRVVQEINPVKPEAEQRTLIFVHGFDLLSQPINLNQWNDFKDALEFKNAYDNMIVISYYGPYDVDIYTKLNGEFQEPTRYEVDPIHHTLMTTIEYVSFLLYQFIRDRPDIIHDNVDFICHSMGGLVTRYMIKNFYHLLYNSYANLGRNFNIENVCMLGTPNHGVSYGWLTALFPVPLPPPTQLAQMAPGSPFLWVLNHENVIPNTEIPWSGANINWFTYRSGIFEILGIRYDGLVDASSVQLNGANNKGLYSLNHAAMIFSNSKMMKTIVYNDLFETPELIQTIFKEGTPGKIIGIEDLTIQLGREILSITLPPEIAIDIDPTSVYIEINSKYQMNLKEGTTDTYEVDLPLAAGDYSFLITADALDGSLYQISGNLKILPDVTSPIIIITSPTDGLITNQDVTLTYTVSDDYTDILDITIIGPVSGTNYNSEGFYEIEITAIDEASNEVTETISFIIDRTAPVIDITSPVDGLITNQNVELFYSVSDDTSALADINVIGPSSGTSFTSEGVHIVEITATDEAGNTASTSLTILIDKTAPVIDITSPVHGLITSQDVDLIYFVSDDSSAPADIDVIGPVSGTTYNSEGVHIVEITATDEAGNTVSETISFIIDRTVPIIDITSPIDGLITNEDVELAYTVSDDVSAPADIDVIPVSGTIYSSEGLYSIMITATDEAGNIASTSLTILIDKTAPVIDITYPIDGLITNQNVELIYTVSDDTSAPANIDINGPQSGTMYSSEGLHEITIIATDEAGNTVSETVSFTIDKTAPVIDITSPIDGLITNEVVELVYTVSDDVSTPADIVVIGPESGDFYTSEGTHTVEITATDEAGNSVSETIFFVIDQIKPVTLILFGAPHLEINNIVHITSATPIELLPLDFSTVTGTFYMVSNDTFDSGWISYEDKFSLDSLILYDGEYKLHYYSIDIAGNEEDHKYETIVLDNSPPILSWEFEGTALQDGILFEIEAGDATGVDESNIVVSIRELNGPIVVDDIPGQYVDGLWQADEIFDTTTLPDGYYELIVDASDAFGFPTTQNFRFSIRNWAVLVLLPSTESNKAGRTMPVKFALRVAFAVDPEMPFVVNQELDIFIKDTATDEILQHSTYGDASKDYRIKEVTEQYITNFKTHKTPTEYSISIYRRNFFIGVFSFTTVK